MTESVYIEREYVNTSDLDFSESDAAVQAPGIPVEDVTGKQGAFRRFLKKQRKRKSFDDALSEWMTARSEMKGIPVTLSDDEGRL
jgi:hypothetical protein